MGLIARGIEKRGIPTVLVGVMWDSMQITRAPRAAFLNFPMAHPFGRPGDRSLQSEILRHVLELLPSAESSGTLVHLPYDWGEPFTHMPKIRKPPSSLGEGGEPSS